MSFDDPQFDEWELDVRENLLEPMKDSAIVMTLFTGPIDVKIAVEIGFAVLLDKPIVVCALAGAAVPENLRKVATEIVELDVLDDLAAHTRIADVLASLKERGIL